MQRLALAVLLAVALCGCATSGPSAPSTEGATTAACTPESLETRAYPDKDVRKAYPDKPDALDRSSVHEYVDAFERAYAWNRKYRSSQDELHVSVHGIDVEPEDDGYVVRVEEVRISQRFEDNSIGDDAWSAHYFVNESVVRRGEGHRGGPGPDEDGWQTIRC